MATPKKREQRIRLKLLGCPVKLDGTVKHMEPDGSSVLIEFDGDFGTVRLYPYGRENSKLMTDKKTTSAVGDCARIFEVI